MRQRPNFPSLCAAAHSASFLELLSSFHTNRHNLCCAGTKEEFKQLNRPTNVPLGAPTSLNKLSNHIPTTGPLSSQDYWNRLDYGSTETVELEGLTVRYAFVTQRGFYPEAPDKANQDAVCVKKEFASTPGQIFYGVFDGHGVNGADAAQFAKAKVGNTIIL